MQADPIVSHNSAGLRGAFGIHEPVRLVNITAAGALVDTHLAAPVESVQSVHISVDGVSSRESAPAGCGAPSLSTCGRLCLIAFLASTTSDAADTIAS